MDEREAVYRSVAVGRLTSPDELTDMLGIARPLDWLILSAIGLLIGGALTWSIVGRLPIMVSGEGILQRAGGAEDVVAPQAGRVSRIWVVGGQTVAAGDPLLELHNGSGALRVDAPFHARVLEVAVPSGRAVPDHAPLLTLELADQPLQAVLFVPESMAGQIQPGFEVRLIPKNFPTQQYGFLAGTVSHVTPAPISDRGLRQALNQEALVQLCIAHRRRIRVDVDLHADRNDPSGWQWSSRSGPARLPSRTEVRGEIVLRQERPIARVLPWARSVGW